MLFQNGLEEAHGGVVVPEIARQIADAQPRGPGMRAGAARGDGSRARHRARAGIVGGEPIDRFVRAPEQVGIAGLAFEHGGLPRAQSGFQLLLHRLDKGVIAEVARHCQQLQLREGVVRVESGDLAEDGQGRRVALLVIVERAGDHQMVGPLALRQRRAQQPRERILPTPQEGGSEQRGIVGIVRRLLEEPHAIELDPRFVADLVMQFDGAFEHLWRGIVALGRAAGDLGGIGCQAQLVERLGQQQQRVLVLAAVDQPAQVGEGGNEIASLIGRTGLCQCRHGCRSPLTLCPEP